MTRSYFGVSMEASAGMFINSAGTFLGPTLTTRLADSTSGVETSAIDAFVRVEGASLLAERVRGGILTGC